MERIVAPLLGWLFGAALLAVGLSLSLSAQWAPGLLLGHGGLLLWGWATWLQHPEID